MNDNDLGRRLRNERGPREEGYVAAQLPSTLDRSGTGGGVSTFRRAAIIVPAAAAGVLAVAVAGSMLSSRPGPFSGTSPTASTPTTESPAEPAACEVQDLSFVAEQWSGAASSRGTVVTVSLAEGRAPCVASTGAAGRITDADGHILVGGIKLLSPVPSVVINPSKAHTIGIAWSNWCGKAPAMPLTVAVKLDNVAQWMVVAELAAAPDPVPPCMREGQSSNLSVTDLQPAQ